MKRTATTDFAILGVLAQESRLSGYDLRQYLEQSVAFFWSESFGQIYPSLARLERQGLITGKVDRESARQRKVYSLTGRGRQQLAHWLDQTPLSERPRNELLLKVFFGAAAPAGSVRKHLKEVLARHEAELAQLQMIEREVAASDQNSSSLVYSLATIRAGIHLARARSEWARETLNSLPE